MPGEINPPKVFRPLSVVELYSHPPQAVDPEKDQGLFSVPRGVGGGGLGGRGVG